MWKVYQAYPQQLTPGDYTLIHSTKLADLLQSIFALHRARLTCLAAVVIALFKAKTVNLAQLATAFPGTAQIDSHYRRLQRFFKDIHLQPAGLATFVLACLPDAPYTLALDRTQWMFGRVPINFLVLSVVHHGIAFPLFFRVLDKRGNSNTRERIALLDQFLTVVGGDKIDCLVADREFIGTEWFAWLRAHHIAFCIRIRHDMKVSRTTGAFSPARNFFRSLPRSTSCSLIGPRLVCGHWLWVSGMHLPCGTYLIVVADRPGHQALERYKQRWQIEVLFEALKSRGFNLEETHLREARRLETLAGVLAIAFCWAYHVGVWRHAIKPIQLKTHQRPARSLFRYGFDGIRQAVLNATDTRNQFEQVLRLLRKVLTSSKAPLRPI